MRVPGKLRSTVGTDSPVNLLLWRLQVSVVWVGEGFCALDSHMGMLRVNSNITLVSAWPRTEQKPRATTG